MRLRPILMTTMAMIFGMLPMALGGGDGGEHARADGPRGDRRRHHLDAADAVVVPVLYTYLHPLGERAMRAWQGKPQPRRIPAQTTVELNRIVHINT